MNPRGRRPAVLLTALALASFPLLPGCGVGYVLSSGYHQAELLASRRPIDRVLEDGGLGAGQEQRLRLIPEIKAYGKGLGLASTDNYDTIAFHWDNSLFNLSACDPLSFDAVTWSFPIVGRVPYLGYFSEADARTKEKELLAQGYDVHVRGVGAYSTLGWFRDPVLPSMLLWKEDDLAETVFHELAHATLWVPGSVAFNESFASFVGEAAAQHYLSDRYGPDSPELASYQRGDRDWRRFEAVLHGLYEDLDKVYQDPALTPEVKAAKKAELYDSLEARTLAAGLEDPLPYVNHVRRSTWNNARLIQFKAYNTDDEAFEAVYERNGKDLRRFIDEVGRLTHGQRDPFAALHRATDHVVQNP